MPRSTLLREIEAQDPLVPNVTSVERHPSGKHRVLLQFNDERPIDLNVHGVMSLCQSLLSVVLGVTPSEYEMELGSAERERRESAAAADAVDPQVTDSGKPTTRA